MLEWYAKSNEVLISERFERSELVRAVSQARQDGLIGLRAGVRQLFDTLAAHRVPLLVFSAGISNVIEEVFSQLDCPLSLRDSDESLTRIVGNKMLFDSEGRLTAFESPLIHMYNKNQSVVPAFVQRQHVIVLGDSIGDAQMADGAATPPQQVLKVGFLNESAEDTRRLAQFEEAFDIIILGDGTMQPVLNLLEKIFANRIDTHAPVYVWKSPGCWA